MIMERICLMKKQKKRFDTFIDMSGMQIHKIQPDLSWLKSLCGVL